MNKKKQANQSMSAKKKKQSLALRTILAQPFPRYWPQITDEERDVLRDHLMELKRSTSPDAQAQKGVSFGLRSSLRWIKNGQAKLLLISADLKPRYVINQIILLALSKNAGTSILCVPQLELLLKEVHEFECFCMSVGDAVKASNLIGWGRKLTECHYPVPPQLVSNFAQREKATRMDVDAARAPANQSEAISVDTLYLRANNGEQRAFVPKNAINLKPLSFKVDSLAKDKNDFISIDNYNSDESARKRTLPKQSKKKSQPALNKQNKYMPTTVWKMQKR